MEKIFKPADIDAVNECREKLKIAVSKLDKLLNDSRAAAGKSGVFLSGKDIPGLVDIATCSLMAPIVNPREYCQAKYVKWFDLIEKQDEDYAKDINYFRSTDIGRFVLETYKDYRAKSNIISS